MKKTLGQVASLAQGQVHDPAETNIIIEGVSKDTRTLERGQLYIPIIGEKFDGHDFISQAEAAGASASLWQKDHPLPDSQLPLVLVEDCLWAFQTMAKNYRASLDIPLIAITGSNGKTSTKDILDSVLSTRYRTHATRGNENNEIGLPLTILNAREDTEVMVVELGTERPGEISLLSKLAQPDVAVITNIGDSHLDELGSKEGVAVEKLSILNGLRPGGVFIYNKDDEYLRAQLDKASLNYKTLSFGQTKDAKYIIDNLDISPGRTRFTVNGASYQVPATGIHQAYNATVSVIISQLFDISQQDLAQGLGQVVFNAMRSQLIQLDGLALIDDSYKANPQNLLASVQAMGHYPGYRVKIAVLADMLDLGGQIDQLHYDTIKKINPDQLDYLILYGDHMEAGYEAAMESFGQARAIYCQTKDQVKEALDNIIVEGSLVLVKGSRSMQMEDIVAYLKESWD